LNDDIKGLNVIIATLKQDHAAEVADLTHKCTHLEIELSNKEKELSKLQ